MATACTHRSREWKRISCFGGRIGESDRYVEEQWQNTCTKCGAVLEERLEKQAAALGPIASNSAARLGPYQPTRPKLTSVVPTAN
jgi:hypothetical protein